MFQEYVFASNSLFKLSQLKSLVWFICFPLKDFVPCRYKVKLYHAAATKDHNLGA